MFKNHPCYIMIVCNKKKYINIISLKQFDLLKNIYFESPEFELFLGCTIKNYFCNKVRIIRDENIITNFIYNFGFTIGEKMIEYIIKSYNDYKFEYNELSLEESDDSFL